MILDEQIVVFFSVFFTTFFIMKALPQKKRSVGRFWNPPSLPTLPVVGSLPFIRQFDNISAFFMEKSNQLGPIFTFRVGSKLILTLNTKEVIEEALVRNSRNFSSRPDIYVDKVSNPNRKGMAFMDTTPQWKRGHQMALTIMKEFGFGFKNIMEERILNEIQILIKFLQDKQGRSFSPMNLTYLVASNIITSIILGHRRDYDLGISQLFHEIEKWALNMDMVYDIAPFLKFIPPFKQRLADLTHRSKNIYANIEAEIDRSLENEVNCFVCRYIEKEGTGYDREQLNYMVRDLIAAGTDTTSTTIQWLLIALANNPEIQRKLQSEIDSVVPRDRLPTLQDESKLIYYQATIQEIYRWRTMLSLSVAHLTAGDSFLRGYFIPSGTIVLTNLHAAHNNPSEWIDPDVFRPERFLSKDNKITGKDRVINFGLGRRSCFGEMLARAEVFLTVASVVQRFTVLPPEGYDKINDKPMLPITMTTKPESFSVRFFVRE